jgi:hypothetical protein
MQAFVVAHEAELVVIDPVELGAGDNWPNRLSPSAKISATLPISFFTVKSPSENHGLLKLPNQLAPQSCNSSPCCQERSRPSLLGTLVPWTQGHVGWRVPALPLP